MTDLEFLLNQLIGASARGEGGVDGNINKLFKQILELYGSPTVKGCRVCGQRPIKAFYCSDKCQRKFNNRKVYLKRKKDYLLSEKGTK